jgi:hypothetical protein
VPLTRMVQEILKRRLRAENLDGRYIFSNQHSTCVADRAKRAAAILCRGGVSFQVGNPESALANASNDLRHNPAHVV